jgi:NAD(P)-dependent dehydrogenase (short-subunit alcohol dehydrogenase family)
MSDGEFAGKVVIVTGAGQGLGRAHALYFAALGAKVVVNDIGEAADTVAAEITEAGGEALALRGSVTSAEAVEDLYGETINTFGDVDIVVNNAGFLRDAMIFSMTEQNFDAVVDVHLKGHWLMNQRAATLWREAHKNGVERPRRIINTTSESGIFGGPAQSNYGPAKGGIIAMTYILAKELGRYGVTVNCIAPRARTVMTEANPRFAKPAEGFDKYDPANVSRVVAWLATDAMGDVNGHVFICAGGTVHLLHPPAVVSTATNDGAWSLDGLHSAKDALFAGVERVIPSWGGPN